MTTIESRAVTITDLPMLRRLSGRGVVLDTEIGFTQDTHGIPTSHISSLIFNRGIYSYVSRAEQYEVLGQFRYKSDDVNAHILYLAPTDEDISDGLWATLLDSMAREAGKLGSHSLIAEVDCHSRLFEMMRQTRFACYMRQTIWRHDPVQATAILPLTDETSNDQIGIMSLICHTIPTLQQAVATPTMEGQGFVYRVEQQVEAYIAWSEGKNGVYIVPFIHPDIARKGADIIESAIARISAASKVPVFVAVRSYQGWLDEAMVKLNFTPVVEQAVMVRQIAVGVRHVAFTRGKLNGKLEPAHRVTPPYWSSAQPLEED